MRGIQFAVAAAFLCLTAWGTASALTVAYGQRDIADAGAGCVGGWKSDHGNTAYFRGNTALLNRQLASLCKGRDRVELVLHSGTKMVAAPEEQPITDFARKSDTDLAIDWSVIRTCPTEAVLTGKCQCETRNTTVHIWVAKRIRVDELRVPRGCNVQASGSLSRFATRRGE